MNSEISILVNSCDSYEDLWFPFFKLFRYYWPNCPHQLILNTETKTYIHPGLNIKCMSLYCHANKAESIAYGQRLRDHLKHIDTKYVIMLLDDFFLHDYVDEVKIDKCKQWMDMNPNIAVFNFEEVRDDLNDPSLEYPGFELRPPIGEYKLNLQAALWRKDTLLKYIKSHESPWEMETFGNCRTYQCKDLFYSIMHNEPRPFNYGFIYAGIWNVYRGKWVKETVIDLFHHHNINIDYNRRGIYSASNLIEETQIDQSKQWLLKRIKLKLSTLRSVGFFWVLREKIHSIKRRIFMRFRHKEIGNYYSYLRSKYKKPS